MNYLLFFFCVSALFVCESVLGDLKVEQVTSPVVHGEGPHWDKEKQVLYFVDITNHSINKYDPKTNKHTKVEIQGGPVTLVVTDKFEENQLVIGRGLDIVSVTWDGESSEACCLKVLATVDKDKPENRFNDGKVDSSGRLWAGTMGPENPDLKLFQGSLYSFDWSDNFTPVKHLSPVSVSNGIAWNRNDTLMYYVDSPTKVVNVFDFDIVKGSISNRREVFSLEKYNISGVPDGMCIDENDNLWIAIYNGAAVIHVDTKTGELLKKIEFPVTKVTSCAFGGENLEELYVTTSRVNLGDEELKEQPLAGALFRISKLGVRGQVKSDKIRTL